MHVYRCGPGVRWWQPTTGFMTMHVCHCGPGEVVAAHHRVHDYACVSLWAWCEVVAAHHWVHDYACCHLQADCQLQDELLSPTLDLRVWELPLSLNNVSALSVSLGKLKCG